MSARRKKSMHDVNSGLHYQQVSMQNHQHALHDSMIVMQDGQDACKTYACGFITIEDRCKGVLKKTDNPASAGLSVFKNQREIYQSASCVSTTVVVSGSCSVLLVLRVDVA